MELSGSRLEANSGVAWITTFWVAQRRCVPYLDTPYMRHLHAVDSSCIPEGASSLRRASKC